MLTNYLLLTGALFNILVTGFTLLMLWVWIIWPAVEAASITRMTVQVRKRHGTEHPNVLKVWLYWFRDLVGGRQFDSIRGNGWYWGGVGDWNVYDRS